MKQLFILLTLIACISGRNVLLSSGLGGWTHAQLWNQYLSFRAYVNMNIINQVSILSYNIQDDGTLGTYNTNDPSFTSEQYQQFIKNELGVKSYPCLYCDATIGNCQNLTNRLQNLYQNQSGFINDTINRGIKYNYDGYVADFEPDSLIDWTQLTDFVLEWSNRLNDNNMTLSLWIGSGTPYDNRIYNNTNIILITMDTYQQSYDNFIIIASNLQTSSYNLSNIGFGLLTNYNFMNNKSNNALTVKNKILDQSDIVDIISWSHFTNTQLLSIWASHIPPDWFIPLKMFVVN